MSTELHMGEPQEPDQPMAQTPQPGDEQSNWTPQARVREGRKDLKLGTTHIKQ